MVDKKRDLAIVELNTIPEDTPAIEIAETSIGPGEMVHSIGNPTAGGVLWTYTSGAVRSVYRKQFHTQAGEHEMRVVETQSPINPGDSGGPVVNTEGKLVAISQSLDPNARLMSYCVDVTEAKDIRRRSCRANDDRDSRSVGQIGPDDRSARKNGICR